MLTRIHAQPRVRERLLALPRRLLRHLARPGPPAVAATLLGHALRCLWRRAGDHRLVGSCSAEFVAHVFGIHVRNVKAARRRLQADGWLRSIAAPRWHVQRFGARWAITPPAARRAASLPVPSGTESPPPQPRRGTKTPPPETKRTLPTGVQEPEAAGRRTLVSAGKSQKHAAPNLRHIEADDLRDDERLRRLLRQALGRRWLSDSEADRLRCFAAAEHALRVGTRNPAGLFAWLLQRRCWSFITGEDEERARRRLRRLATCQEKVPDVRDAQRKLTALVSRTASVLSLPSWLERAKACIASASPAKNTAVGSSPQPVASSLMACMASSTNSTFSASVARNTAGSKPSVGIKGDAESIPGACHTGAARSRGIRAGAPKPQRNPRKSRRGAAAAA